MIIRKCIILFIVICQTVQKFEIAYLPIGTIISTVLYLRVIKHIRYVGIPYSLRAYTIAPLPVPHYVIQIQKL